MRKHILEKGESLVTIAKQYGFLDWHPIYDHLANEDLRKKRGHPNALRTGDEVFIPEKVRNPLVLETGKRHELTVVIGRGVWKLAWSQAKASCGTKVTLTGETNLPDGDLKLRLTPRELPSPKLSAPTVSIKGGKLKYEWEVKDVQHLTGDTPPKAFGQVHLEVTTEDPLLACNVAVLVVEAVETAPVQSFSEDHTWNNFANRSRFEQRIDKFVNLVELKPNVMKGWGASYINMQRAGITGTAGGCPWAGYRWGRSTGMSMAPNQYHNGTAWVPLPAGFTPTASEYQGAGFYKTGATFVPTIGGTFPTPFPDYDFNGPDYTKVRSDWRTLIHDHWTDQFHIQREGCTSDKSVTCCRYKVDVAMTFVEVATYAAGVILMAPGNARSNLALWFMDQPASHVPCHETGHLLNNPDEYAEGACDPTVSGDGAVNGLDASCIMGVSLSTVKKRHYGSMVEMTGRLVKAVSGRTETYKAVDK